MILKNRCQQIYGHSSDCYRCTFSRNCIHNFFGKDNPIEELCEEVLKEEVGLDIDFHLELEKENTQWQRLNCSSSGSFQKFYCNRHGIGILTCLSPK